MARVNGTRMRGWIDRWMNEWNKKEFKDGWIDGTRMSL